jgi:RNA polymerase sigma factor (sigma-70 family)
MLPDPVTGLDADSFGRFVASHYRRLVGLLLLGGDDIGTAEELAQDALVRLYEHRARLVVQETPWAWVCVVALNLQRSSWRRSAARRRAYRRHGLPLEAGDLPDPDDVIAVRAAVAALPRRQHEVVCLRFYADLPVAVTAARLGLAEGTIKALTHQAIASLRRSLLSEPEEVHRG